MVRVKPFKGIRPQAELAEKVSALPYDVMNRSEAKEMAQGNEYSFLHISRAEIDFPEEVGDYEECVYQKARENLLDFVEKGILFMEDKPVYYIYREIMGETVQTGIVAAVAVADYENGSVMKHELTRKEKEQDRIHHFDVCNCHTEPVFLTYRHKETIDKIVGQWISEHQPEYNFTSSDGVAHILWVVDNDTTIDQLQGEFKSLEKIYIADGNHRSASAAAIGKLRRQGGNIDESAPSENFLAVIFPDAELSIMAYNRVVKRPEDKTPADILAFLGKLFTIKPEESLFYPERNHEIALYLAKKWYRLTAPPELYASDDPAENLDAAILQREVMEPLFEIKDVRTDKRIDFIGGIRGNEEIERRCDNEDAIGFALYPVSISDLMAIADSGKIMPPKSTWFEPKLRSGLFLHYLDSKINE